MDSKDIIFIMKSEIRFYILISLKDKKQTPTELAKNSRFHLSHVSSNLKKLTEADYIMCEECHSNKNKIFTLSKKGKNFLKFINQITYLPEDCD